MILLKYLHSNQDSENICLNSKAAMVIRGGEGRGGGGEIILIFWGVKVCGPFLKGQCHK